MIKNDGERFIPTQSGPVEIHVNLDRYMFAMDYCKERKVLELGCGCGLGTYIYSLVANHITAVDYSDQAIEYAKTYPFDPSKVEFRNINLEKEVPQGKFDITVAMEVLEHLENPGELIEKIDTKYLVFSLPLYSMLTSKWHKYEIRPGKEGLQDVDNLIGKFYQIENIQIQERVGAKMLTGCNWVMGIAKKRKSWL